MRASRLVTILLLLQQRTQMTAAELAEALEVSVRTIYRDLEALSAAGVPVYAEPGRNGGCRLIDGYRTRLTGLSKKEAEALFAAGVTGPMGQLGFGTVLGTAQLKLLAVLSKDLADRASSVAERFHLDAPGWFRSVRNDEHLAASATAVWEDRRVVVRYRHPGADEDVARHLEPFGLVSKGGVWYLVARRDGELRTYRVSRVHDVVVDDECFDRPTDFDLAEYWAASVSEFEADVPAVEVVMRATPEGFDALRRLTRPYGTTTDWDEQLADGTRRCVTVFENLDDAYFELIRMGSDVEVLEPKPLRARLAETARATAALYSSST